MRKRSFALCSLLVAAAAQCASQPIVTVTNRGQVMTQPKIHFVFWGQYWRAVGSGGAANLVRAFHQVPPAYFFGLSQYGVGYPELAGMTVTALYEPPTTVTIGDVATVIERLMVAGILPSIRESSRAVYYMVLLPPDRTLMGSQGGVGGFHTFLLFPDLSEIWFGYTTTAYGTMLPFHELIEGMTDPSGQGVQTESLVSSRGWSEIADACVHVSPATIAPGFDLPAYWSQQDGACIAPGAQPPHRHSSAVR